MARTDGADTQRFWGIYALAWTPILPVYALLFSRERQTSLISTLPATALSVGSAAVLGAALWPLTAWLEKRGRVWLIVLHVAAALVYSVCLVGVSSLRLLVAQGPESANAYVRSTGTGWQLVIGMWMYGVIGAVFHTVRAHRRVVEREQALARAEAQRAQAEALRAAAELQALRARLNPHFFFNTLQALAPLVRRDAEVAALALEQFGTMMRYVLEDAHDRAPSTIAAELRFVRTYLELEQLRFGSRLQIVESIDQELLDLPLPSLTLQPLVENAIVHGIAPSSTPGTIWLTVRRNGEFAEIEIADDGQGGDSTLVNDRQGIGIESVRRRLELAYGGRAHLRIGNASSKGFRVTLVLPDDDGSAVWPGGGAPPSAGAVAP